MFIKIHNKLHLENWIFFLLFILVFFYGDVIKLQGLRDTAFSAGPVSGGTHNWGKLNFVTLRKALS